MSPKKISKRIGGKELELVEVNGETGETKSNQKKQENCKGRIVFEIERVFHVNVL